MRISIQLLVLCFICIGALVSKAETSTTDLLSTEEKLIRQKARLRSYPGGKDEEPLKVQVQLPSASRKMQPAQEPIEVAEPVENHTNDSND